MKSTDTRKGIINKNNRDFINLIISKGVTYTKGTPFAMKKATLKISSFKMRKGHLPERWQTLKTKDVQGFPALSQKVKLHYLI
jgi:hypothetical protein